jgi:hypothetical protein
VSLDKGCYIGQQALAKVCGVQCYQRPCTAVRLHVVVVVTLACCQLPLLVDRYEAGLCHAVSLDKGCYIGQEPLAKVGGI